MIEDMILNEDKFWDWHSFKLIIKKAIPAILTGIMSAFIPFVDNFVSGTISDDSEASVSYSGTIQFTVFILVLGFFGAIGVVMAQFRGAKDFDKVRDAHKLKVVSGLGITAFFSIFVFIMPETLLRIFTSNESIINEGKNFLRLYGVVMILSSLTNGYGGSLSSLGYVRISLYITLIAIGLNTGLDFMFVLWLGMGTDGLAYATIIVQVIGFGFILLYVHLKKITEIMFNPLKIFAISKDVIIKSAKRWHMVITEFSFGVGIFALNIVMAKSYDDQIAAGAIIGVFTPFVSVIFSSIGGFYAAIAIFVGMNLGKDKLKLAYMNTKRIILISFVMAMVFSGTVSALAPYLTGMFYAISDDVNHQAVMILRYYPVVIPAFLFGILSYRFLEAGGQSKIVMLFDFINTWAFLFLGTFLIFFVWNPSDFWVAWLISSLVRYGRAILGALLIKSKVWLVNLNKGEPKDLEGWVFVLVSCFTLGMYNISLLMRRKQNKV